MALVGQSIDNRLGDRITFRGTSQSSAGQLVAFDLVVAPAAGSPPLHVHTRQAESFTVISGTIALTVDRQLKHLDAGESATIPAGTPHTFGNGGESEAIVVVELRPALEFENFLAAVYGLQAAGKTNSKGFPNPLQMAVILAHHLPEYHLAKPPLLVQKTLLAIFAPIGRRGYTPSP